MCRKEGDGWPVPPYNDLTAKRLDGGHLGRGGCARRLEDADGHVRDVALAVVLDRSEDRVEGVAGQVADHISARDLAVADRRTGDRLEKHLRRGVCRTVKGPGVAD